LEKLVVHRPPQSRAPHGSQYLTGRNGDRGNAGMLAAAGYNFGLFLRSPARLLSAPVKTLFAAPSRAQIA
jgi:hypothetical protein